MLDYLDRRRQFERDRRLRRDYSSISARKQNSTRASASANTRSNSGAFTASSNRAYRSADACCDTDFCCIFLLCAFGLFGICRRPDRYAAAISEL